MEIDMPEAMIWKCDSCKKIIEQPRDVYRLEMKGDNWEQACPAGGHSDTMRNVKNLFSANCQIAASNRGQSMIGQVKDIIEDEEFATAMIQIPKEDAKRLWERMGKKVVIAWVE
jgi:hypothetical protein